MEDGRGKTLGYNEGQGSKGVEEVLLTMKCISDARKCQNDTVKK